MCARSRDDISVESTAEQHRAQEVFVRHGVVPTYMVDYPVAMSEQAVQVLGGFLADGRCEIGAHLHRRKHGFGLPYGPWLKTVPALQEIAFDSLAKLKRRGYFRDAYIDRVVAAHRESDHHAPAGRIWDLMMLELWLQHHVDRRAIAPAVPQAV